MIQQTSRCDTCIYKGPGTLCWSTENEPGRQQNCKKYYVERCCENCGFYKFFGASPVCGARRGGRKLLPVKEQKKCKDWAPKGDKPLRWKHQDDSIDWR